MSAHKKDKQPKSLHAVLLQPLDNPIDLREMVTFRLLRIAAKLTQGFIQSYTAKFGIGLPEWRTLGMLGKFGPLPSIRIAELAEMDRASISRTVAWLEKQDMVRRLDDPGHQRRKIVAMTGAGKRLHDRICAHAQQRQKQIIASLSDIERSVLDQLLGKMDAWATELHSEARPAQGAAATAPLATRTQSLPVSSGTSGRDQLLLQVAQLKRAIEIYV